MRVRRRRLVAIFDLFPLSSLPLSPHPIYLFVWSPSAHVSRDRTARSNPVNRARLISTPTRRRRFVFFTVDCGSLLFLVYSLSCIPVVSSLVPTVGSIDCSQFCRRYVNTHSHTHLSCKCLLIVFNAPRPSFAAPHS